MGKVGKGLAVGFSGNMAAVAVEVALDVSSSWREFLPLRVAWERKGETRFQIC